MDELPARFDHLPHQRREHVLGLVGVGYPDLQERAGARIEGGFPELLRVHLAQALVALNRRALAAELHDRVYERHGAGDRAGAVLGHELSVLEIGGLQLAPKRVDAARLGAADDGAVYDMALGHAPQGAGELEPAVRQRSGLPAALGLGTELVEALGDIAGRFLRPVPIRQNTGVQGAGDRRLLDHRRVADMAHQRRQEPFDRARTFDHRLEVVAGPLAAVIEGQHRVLQRRADEIAFERAIVLEVDLGAAALGAVERRLGDVEVTAVDDRGHMAVEEGQEQGADVAAVHVGVGHDDDPVVAQLADIEIFRADAGA